jgi:hypothetical protein
MKKEKKKKKKEKKKQTKRDPNRTLLSHVDSGIAQKRSGSCIHRIRAGATGTEEWATEFPTFEGRSSLSSVSATRHFSVVA